MSGRRAATVLLLLSATFGTAQGQAFSGFYVRHCACFLKAVVVEFGAYGPPSRKPVVEFESDNAHEVKFLVVDIDVTGGQYVFRIPEDLEGGGLYRGRRSTGSFDGTWTHGTDSGTTVTESVHWPVTQLIP